jgi:primosomal protein N' (replication factor Y) (superfamily II helicase)
MSARGDAEPLVVRVLPDVAAVRRTFDYLVPDHLRADVRVGTIVRIELHGRRVRGWVVEVASEPPAGVTLKPIAKVTGYGPPSDVVDLAEWAAWRWAGPPTALLGTASPPTAVRRLPPARKSDGLAPATSVDPGAEEALTAGRAVVRLPPAGDPFPYVLAAATRGDALVVCPSVGLARRLARELRRAGIGSSIYPDEWADAAAGGTVIGARAAAWAPVKSLAAVVVIDEHDEVHQEERTPTWHARDVVIERARRSGAPCVLLSPCPTLESQAWGDLRRVSTAEERRGWPVVDVVDRRHDDPRSGLYSDRLIARLRGDGRGRVVGVLNRKGRSRLLACVACGEVARCQRCGAAVAMPEPGGLVCGRCGETRPQVCLACGGTAMKNLRVGVSRVREELEALLGERVAEGTGATAGDDRSDWPRVVVGTEAVLHQISGRVDIVAFLDFDQELLAPRYRAAEQALGLLARAGRVLGGRLHGGRLVIQTRVPTHPVVQAALHADPGRLADEERPRRRAIGYPPFTALAAVSGPVADQFIDQLGARLGVEVLGPADGRWLLRAADHATLCDALAATPRPPGRLRVEVDPLRI